MRKQRIGAVLAVILSVVMVVPTLAASSMTGASYQDNATDNTATINESFRMDTDGSSYSYTLKSANDYKLNDGSYIFAYNDIRELAKDVVDIRNYLSVYVSPDEIDNLITEYDPLKIYESGQYVIYENAIYRAKAGKSNITGNFEPALWDLIIDSSDDTYNETVGYIQGEFVIYNSNLWFAKQDIESPAGPFDATKWQRVQSIFDSTNYYLYVRRLQAYCDRLDALVDQLNAETSVINAEPYNPAATYNPGDMCLYENHVYICLTSTSGTFDPSRWSQVNSNSGVGAQAAEHEAKLDSTKNDLTNLTNVFSSTGLMVESTATNGNGDTVVNVVWDVEPVIDLEINQ